MGQELWHGTDTYITLHTLNGTAHTHIHTHHSTHPMHRTLKAGANF